MNIINNIKEYEDIKNKNETIIIFCCLEKCPPCKEVYPKYEELCNKNMNNNIKYYKITFDLNNEEHKKLKDIFEVKKFPSFVMINNGIILETIQTIDIEQIINILNYI